MLKHTAILASLLVTAAVAGCSRGEQPSANVQASAAPAPAAAPVANGGRKVEIIANDTMKFSIVEIHAKAGERLSVTLVNQGATPKFSMGHNWILLTPGADVDAVPDRGRRGGRRPTTCPRASAQQILASTKLLGPGEQRHRHLHGAAGPGPLSIPLFVSRPRPGRHARRADRRVNACHHCWRY